MPVYKVNIDRRVITWDRFTRFIEADTFKAAETIGNTLANAANSDCPDDAGPGNFDDELYDWDVNDVALASAEDLEGATDYQLHNVTEEDDE